MMTENAIVYIDPQQAVREVQQRIAIVGELYKTTLRPNVDFGIVPGTSKPTLLKPGAEHLCAAFHLDPHFDTITAIEDFDKPLFFYRVKCRLIHIETGLEIATGIGSCNSMESKYRYRKAERVCPTCGKPTIIKGKDQYGGGWLCYGKKGGCGAKFGDNDPAIVNQENGNVPNEDIFSLVNTLDKMACKRALIAAVLIACNASEFFTQDVEDIPGFSVVDNEAGEITAPNAKPVAGQPQAQPAGSEPGLTVVSHDKPAQPKGKKAKWDSTEVFKFAKTLPRYVGHHEQSVNAVKASVTDDMDTAQAIAAVKAYHDRKPVEDVSEKDPFED